MYIPTEPADSYLPYGSVREPYKTRIASLLNDNGRLMTSETFQEVRKELEGKHLAISQLSLFEGEFCMASRAVIMGRDLAEWVCPLYPLDIAAHLGVSAAERLKAWQDGGWRSHKFVNISGTRRKGKGLMYPMMVVFETGLLASGIEIPPPSPLLVQLTEIDHALASWMASAWC